MSVCAVVYSCRADTHPLCPCTCSWTLQHRGADSGAAVASTAFIAAFATNGAARSQQQPAQPMAEAAEVYPGHAVDLVPLIVPLMEADDLETEAAGSGSGMDTGTGTGGGRGQGRGRGRRRRRGRGRGRVSSFLPFDEALAVARGLKLRGSSEWNEWCKSSERLPTLPTAPQTTYKNKGWEGMGHWLGTSNARGFHGIKGARVFLPFEDALVYARDLKLKGSAEWNEWCKTQQRPHNIPAAPYVQLPAVRAFGGLVVCLWGEHSLNTCLCWVCILFGWVGLGWVHAHSLSHPSRYAVAYVCPGLIWQEWPCVCACVRVCVCVCVCV